MLRRPCCSDLHVWCRFVKELYDAKVILVDITPRDEKNVFMTKKNGKLRMIIVCRGSNKRFKRAPLTVLRSLEAWARLLLNAGESSTQRVAHQINGITGLHGRSKQHQPCCGF